MIGYRLLAICAIVSQLCFANILQSSSSSNIIFNERKMLFEKKSCEKITVPMCQGLEYNVTSMPNQFNHETQQDAAIEVCFQFLTFLRIFNI